MNINLEFERDHDGRWYAVIPSWEGDRSDLEMVMGADEMLEILSKNYFEESGRFSLNLTNPLPSRTGKTHNPKMYLCRLDKDTSDFGGSFYQCYFGHLQSMEIWLCSVTEFVFGEYPETILID